MTPKERVLTAIRGQRADRVPFTAYYEAGIIPLGEYERRLRSDGMTMIKWCPLWTSECPNVQWETTRYCEDGQARIRETMKTPVGEVSASYIPGMAYGTTRVVEYFIKGPDDYRVVQFMVEDAVYRPDYEPYHKLARQLGDDGVVMCNIGYSPFQRMWIEFMGTERLCLDLVDCRSQFDALYEAILARQKECWQFVADSPAELIEYGGNITGDVIGPDRFRRYHMPVYNEFAAMLHAKGKLLSVHMDGMLAALKDVIAETDIDIVEALTPPPDGDLTLAEARAAWRDKIIWINFPSSLHIAGPERICDSVDGLLREAAPGDRFLIGITENVPDTVIQQSLPAISQRLQEKGNLPLP